MKKCKRCLLLEAGEKASYKTVSDYIDNLDNSSTISGPIPSPFKTVIL